MSASPSMAASNSAVRRRLILSPVPEGFDPARETLIGPWCFVDREERTPGWEDLDYHDALSGGEDVRREALTARRLAETVVSDLAMRLNDRHRRSYSVTYWRTLLMPWLLALSQIAWKRYLTVEDFIRRGGDESFDVTLCEDVDVWHFVDTLDFAERGLIGPAFNYWLISRIIALLAPGHWVITHQAIDRQDSLSRQAVHTSLRGSLRRMLGRVRFSGVTGAGPWMSLALSAWLALRRGDRLPVSPDGTARPSPGRPVPPQFMALFAELAEATMPASFGSRFVEFEGRSRRHTYRAGKVFVRGCVLWYDEDEKFAAAQALEAGEKLVTVQHGGNYGIAMSFPDAAEIEYKHAAFVSWGWHRQDGHPGNIIPLPTPHLCRFRDNYARTTDNLILVGTQQRVFSFRLDSSPQPAQWLDYRRQKAEFIEALADNPLENLLYRPGQEEPSTLRDAAWLSDRVPDLRLLTGALHPEILRCRLLVLDHPGTTLNIALAANIPTVCFWRDDAWPVCREAEPVFRSLCQCGILFEGGPEAAAQVNEIWRDPVSWWQGARVQDTRRAFCDSYAKTDRLWWLSWLRTL